MECQAIGHTVQALMEILDSVAEMILLGRNFSKANGLVEFVE